MGYATRRKPAASERDTEAEILATKATMEDLAARLTAVGAERDARLLDDDPAGVDKADADLATIRRDQERAERRLSLLEQRAADEMNARIKVAQDERMARLTAKFAERDAEIEELADCIEAMIESYRKVVAVNAVITQSWPFAVTDNQAAMFGTHFKAAVSYEIYRLSGAVPAGVDSLNLGEAGGRDTIYEFPGARSPNPVNSNPGAVRPLIEEAKLASGYALARVSAAPLQIVEPSVAPARVLPVEIGPAEPLAIKPNKAEPPPAGGHPQYIFNVKIVNVVSGERRTSRILLDEDRVRLASEGDPMGLGPSGPRGCEIAMVAAMQTLPEGFVVDAAPDAVTLDLAALIASINGEPIDA